MTTAAHVHRWLLETPHGPTVTGRCKLCGKTRTYPSSIDYEAGPFSLKAARGAALAAQLRRLRKAERLS